MAKQALRRVEIKKGRNGWTAKTKNGRAFATGRTKAALVKKAASEGPQERHAAQTRTAGAAIGRSWTCLTVMRAP